jgi:hypothetical protein
LSLELRLKSLSFTRLFHLSRLSLEPLASCLGSLGCSLYSCRLIRLSHCPAKLLACNLLS